MSCNCRALVWLKLLCHSTCHVMPPAVDLVGRHVEGCSHSNSSQLPMSRLPSEVADSVKNGITLSSNQLTRKDVGVTPVKWEPCINSPANSSCFYANSVWLSWFDVATCSKLRFWLPSRFPSAISFWPPEHPHLSNDSNGIILPMSSMSSLRERTPAPHVPWMDMAALAAPRMEAPWLGKKSRTIRTPQVHLSHRLISIIWVFSSACINLCWTEWQPDFSLVTEISQNTCCKQKEEMSICNIPTVVPFNVLLGAFPVQTSHGCPSQRVPQHPWQVPRSSSPHLRLELPDD